MGWVFLPLFVLLLIFLPPRLIKISKIECAIQYGLCPEDIEQRIKNKELKSLSEIKENIKKIMSDYYYVTDFSMQFKIPSTLRVEILVKKPIFAIKQKNTQNFALIDKNGKILAVSQNSGLPTIVTEYPIKSVGTSVEPKELLAMKLISGVFSMYQINLGNVEGTSLLVDLPPGLRVIFPLGEDVDRDVALGSLRVIYSKVMEEPGKYREIDLRFRNPVLR